MPSPRPQYHTIRYDPGTIAYTIDVRLATGHGFHVTVSEEYVSACGGLVALEWMMDDISRVIHRGPVIRNAPREPMSFASMLSPPSATTALRVEREPSSEYAQRIFELVNARVGSLARDYERRDIPPSPVATMEESIRNFERMIGQQAAIPAQFFIDEAARMNLPTRTGATFVEELSRPVAPPNAGVAPLDRPSHFLGYPIVWTGNVARGRVVMEQGSLYINQASTLASWQAAARVAIARHARGGSNVSIKATCRWCGKAYPSRQGVDEPDRYCSDKCRAAAVDTIDCPTCSGTGTASTEGGKCGDCWGSSYMSCEACGMNHARPSLTMLNTRNGKTYIVCPSCVPEERDAGAVQAPVGTV